MKETKEVNSANKPLNHPLLLIREMNCQVLAQKLQRHLGPAVKQLAPLNLQSPLIEGKNISGSNVSTPSIQLKRTLGSKQGGVWDMWLDFSRVLGKMLYATALGCILVALLKLINLQPLRLRTESSGRRMDNQRTALSSATLIDSSLGLSFKRSRIKQNGFMRQIQKVLSLIKMQSGDHLESADLQAASLSAGLSSLLPSTCRLPMPIEDAEALVKRWQASKAEALGPNHNIHGLVEILDGPMLAQGRQLRNRRSNIRLKKTALKSSQAHQRVEAMKIGLFEMVEHS